MSTSVEKLQQAKEDYSQAKIDAESALLDLQRVREQYDTAESNLAIAAIPPITRSILTQRTSELASARLQVAEKEIIYTTAQANELAKKIAFNIAEKNYQLEQLKELEIPDENIEIPVVVSQTVTVPLLGSKTITIPTGQTVSVPLSMLALASTGTGLDVVPEAVTTALNTVGILPEEGSVSGPGGTFSRGNSIAANVVATNQITAPSITTSGSVTADNLVTNLITPTVPGTGTVTVLGTLAATIKAFDIAHPTKENKRLRYSSLEGPEAGVYVRGKTSEGIITLPDYWAGLVDEKTITVHLTPTNMDQTLVVNNVNGLTIQVLGNHRLPYYYYVMAERKDIDKLQVEYDA